MNSIEPLKIDVRPACEKGKAPLGIILNAVQSLQPGQDLELIAPFKPLPLLSVLKQMGFSNEQNPLNDGSWKITFHKSNGGS